MAYESLKSLYYQDKNLYTETYQQRITTGIPLPIAIHGHPAFFVENQDVTSLVYRILRTDKEIALLRQDLPGVALLQYSRKCLIDEIVLTNQIEGIHSSRKEIGGVLETLSNSIQKKGTLHRFEGIVKKYNLLTQGKTALPKTCEEIRKLYDELVSDEVMAENPKHQLDGILFRKEQTDVVNAAQKIIHSGVYPEASILSTMEQALSFLHEEPIEPLYRICLFHYLFEYIHPFYDGNGRTGRFLVSCGLSQVLEPLLAYRLSEIIKENINDYYQAFSLCNHRWNLGDATPFLLMMLELILKAAEELRASLSRKKKDWESDIALIPLFPHAEEKNMAALYNLLIQATRFSENGISTQDLKTHLSVSYRSVWNLLKKIEPASLLLEQQVGREKYYCLNQEALDELRLTQLGL